MAIKPEADKYYFSSRLAERELAHNLDEAFNITFGNSHGQLSFWLAEPKPNIKERFGLQQEVLVIYSPHIETDARVLTAIENISRNPDFKHRVEKVLFLLIHKGNPITTENLVKSQQDRIIVPIHVSELLNPHRGGIFLRSIISRAIGHLDLFGMASPITSDKYFFSRDDLVQTLITRSAIRHENSGLFGLRKTGKTSVLRAIQRRLSERPILTEYIDCSNPGVHAARWWQVLESLIARCKDTLKREHKRDVQTHITYTESSAGSHFTSDIKAILRDGNLAKIVLMLDEIEYITSGLSGALGRHWDKDFVPFWQTIRATHQEVQDGFSFIVAGVNPACVENSHFAGIPNPIFQLAVPQYLEPFPVHDVRDMVRSIGRYAGLKFEESVYPYLQETYGGHPFLIRVACSEVWKASDTLNPEAITKVSVKEFHSLQPNIKARLAQPIKDILLSLVWWYPEEYELLLILASGDTEFVKEYLRERPESVVQFARYGILKSAGDGKFAIADLVEFLNERGESYKKEISPFTRGDMPPELLPAVPDLRSLGKLFEKRTEIEIKLRKAIMLYLGVQSNWDSHKISIAMIKGLHNRSDRKEPRELFVGQAPQDVINELFTLDLKSIIVMNWEVFAPLFDNHKIRFEMNMDTLNKARRVDAHTKPFTHEEAMEFENSYSWLLNRLARLPT